MIVVVTKMSFHFNNFFVSSRKCTFKIHQEPHSQSTAFINLTFFLEERTPPSFSDEEEED